MATTIRLSNRLQGKVPWTKIMLISGILSSLLYVAMNIFVAMQYPGYSSSSQTISELSAVGAPTRPLWVLLGTLYTLMIAAFGWGVWQSAGENRALRVVGVLMIIQGLIGIYWPPMHQREVLAAGGGTLTDTLHIAFTMITVPLMLVSIGFGAAAFGKRFRVYSMVSILILLLFGLMTGLDTAAMTANLPTPWMGVWERISVAAYMLWVVVLAIMLLRAQKHPDASTVTLPDA